MIIYQTINIKNNNTNDGLHQELKHLIENECTNVRINIKSLSEEDICRVNRLIDCIEKEDVARRLNIALDLPYPKNKLRLHINNSFNVEKNARICVYNESLYDKQYLLENNCIYASKDFFNIRFEQCKEYYFGDGEGVLHYECGDNKKIVFEAQNDFLFFDNKSISYAFEKSSFNTEQISFLNDLFKRNVRTVFLSFCENWQEVEAFRKIFGDKKLEIFAKIETQLAVDNLCSILEYVDGVVLARGDLCLYTDIKKFLYNQNLIANKVRKYNKKLIVATDILSSLANQNLPSRADLCDLQLLMSYYPYGLVLKSSIFYQRRYNVVNKLIRLHSSN